MLFHIWLNCWIFSSFKAACCSNVSVCHMCIFQIRIVSALVSFQWCGMSVFITNDANSMIQPIGYFVMVLCFMSLIKQSDGEKWILTFRVSKIVILSTDGWFVCIPRMHLLKSLTLFYILCTCLIHFFLLNVIFTLFSPQWSIIKSSH